MNILIKTTAFLIAACFLMIAVFVCLIMFGPERLVNPSELDAGWCDVGYERHANGRRWSRTPMEMNQAMDETPAQMSPEER